MTRSKLSAADKQDLIQLFKETSETITNLAERFGVSVSTARRILKLEIMPEEYEAIVTRRQGTRQGKKHTPSANSSANSQAEMPSKRSRRTRHRRVSPDPEDGALSPKPTLPDPKQAPSVLSAQEEEDIIIPGNGTQQAESSADTGSRSAPLQVLPIDDADLPKQCYLVVDRASELITRPLKDFSELGAVPQEEESAQTLPVFSNHKLASRFLRRSQRVVKIPNTDLLEKTYPLLSARGIKRILYDGQVFTLVTS
ncbi:hypothetical protein [Lyngbya confervoides]|uniref:Transposase n=1 Tax=Lyngbya confervoides BDU141951 TaxID=1574623 RepID=A0ABD4SZV4_9CYAN|nr:hypothetical protein [Lyngbya confervoides]MCM1981909.1 hypothetical protein [Lyngbya confervoides BDU141951]